MGKMLENPRNNVLSFRATDEDTSEIRRAAGDLPVADFLAEAVREKLINDRQRQFNSQLRAALRVS